MRRFGRAEAGRSADMAVGFQVDLDPRRRPSDVGPSMPRSSFDRSRGSSRSSLATEAPSESAQLLPVTNNRRSSSDSLDWAIAQASTSDHPTGTSFDDRATYGGASAAHAADKAERDQRGSLDVAFDLAGSVLHPAPLLIAHVFELTGLYIGIPALFIVAALCWFAHGIYAVCLRYTGGSTLNALASGVLPRAWGGQFTSEVLVDLGVLFVSLGRAAVLLSLIANLVSSSPAMRQLSCSILTQPAHADGLTR